MEQATLLLDGSAVSQHTKSAFFKVNEVEEQMAHGIQLVDVHLNWD